MPTKPKTSKKESRARENRFLFVVMGSFLLVVAVSLANALVH